MVMHKYCHECDKSIDLDSFDFVDAGYSVRGKKNYDLCAYHYFMPNVDKIVDKGIDGDLTVEDIANKVFNYLQSTPHFEDLFDKVVSLDKFSQLWDDLMELKYYK